MISHWNWTRDFVLKATEEGKLKWKSLDRDSGHSGQEAWLTGTPIKMSNILITFIHDLRSVQAQNFRRPLKVAESGKLEIEITGIGVRTFATDMDIYPDAQEQITMDDLKDFEHRLLTIQDRLRDPVFSFLKKSL